MNSALHHCLLLCVVGLGLCTTPSRADAQPPTHAGALSEPSEGHSVDLEVSINLGGGDQEVAQVVRETVTRALAGEHIAIREGAETVLVVEVRLQSDSATDFTVTLSRRRGPERSAPPFHAFNCDGCSAPQLLARLEADVATTAPVHLQPPPPPQPEPKPAPVVASVAPPPPPSSSSDRVRLLRDDDPWLLAGVFTLALGGAVMVGAVVPMAIYANNGESLTTVQWSLLGAGAAVAVVGGALVGVGAVRVGQRRRSVTLRPSGRGLAFAGRF